MKRRQRHNQGITLIELLITLVIGGIVISAVIILLRQGMNSYSRQTISAQLQNDANIALNQLSDAIMQAECINIFNVDSNHMTTSFVTRTGTDGNAYVFDAQHNNLYVGTKPNIIDYEQMGLLSRHVEEFRVKILNSSVTTEKSSRLIDGQNVTVDKINGIHNPIQIKVSVKVTYKNVSREVSRVTSLRNHITDFSKFTIGGQPLNSFPDKDALQDYLTD